MQTRYFIDKIIELGVELKKLPMTERIGKGTSFQYQDFEVLDGKLYFKNGAKIRVTHSYGIVYGDPGGGPKPVKELTLFDASARDFVPAMTDEVLEKFDKKVDFFDDRGFYEAIKQEVKKRKLKKLIK